MAIEKNSEQQLTSTLADLRELNDRLVQQNANLSNQLGEAQAKIDVILKQLGEALAKHGNRK